jgi:hypothetical protein
VHGAGRIANNLYYSKYLVSIILLRPISEFHFIITDSNMLSHIEFNSSYTHARFPIVHTSPYFEYVFASHIGSSHAKRCVYHVVVCLYKLL